MRKKRKRKNVDENNSLEVEKDENQTSKNNFIKVTSSESDDN